MKFTEEQQSVIDARNSNLLVSAAAGSGKTAVLVERILQRVMDPKAPVDIDRMLIMTFTRAAAAEMKSRLQSKMRKAQTEAEAEGNNAAAERLRRQGILLRGAYISTIDGFCTNILRNHFGRIGIDPTFRVAEEGELKLLRREVLGEVLERAYDCDFGENAEITPDEFYDFIENFSVKKSDKDIEEAILDLYAYSQSDPFPEEWIDRMTSGYEAKSVDELFALPVVRQYISGAIAQLRDIAEDSRNIADICQESDGPYMYAAVLEAEAEELNKLVSLIDSGDQITGAIFDEIRSLLESYKFDRLPSKKDDSVNPAKKEMVRAARDKIKNSFKKIKSEYFYSSSALIFEAVGKSKNSVKVLKVLTRMFHDAYSEEKNDRKMVDFSDLEHMTLRIMYDGTTAEDRKPSAVALQYRALFEEILVDEYQDSNLVQEKLLEAIVRHESGKRNLFMVGDVKQSIYKFRLAKPELFMKKREEFSLKEFVSEITEGQEIVKRRADDRRIDLHRNFRSRREVVRTVNFLFDQLMIPEVGGVAYDADARLCYGAEYYNEAGELVEDYKDDDKPQLSPEGEIIPGMWDSEMIIVDEEESLGRIASEAKAISARIKGLMETQLVQDKDTKKLRRVRYSDIAILLRATEEWDEIFRSTLEADGIPCYAESKKGYFASYEVRCLLNLLLAINNFRDDEILAAFLKGPFGKISDEELALIRIAHRDVPFYEAYAACVKEENENIPRFLQEKLQKAFEMLQKYREMSEYLAVHELLARILQDTHFDMQVLAMERGRDRNLNITMLMEKAIAFERTSYKGLFHFVRYVQQMKKYEIDFGQAQGHSESDDAVRIMTIHKSKGLEFPVCFVSGLGKQFNLMDLKARILMDADNGIGIDCIDSHRRVKTKTMIKRAMEKSLKSETYGEELRVLYVALTRAREKLIMTGVMKIDKLVDYNVKSLGIIKGRKLTGLSAGSITEANGFLQWIIMGLCRNRSFYNVDNSDILEPGEALLNPLYTYYLPLGTSIYAASDMVTDEVEKQAEEDFARQTYEALRREKKEEGSKNPYEEAFSWRYPYDDSIVPVKVSVSFLKHEAMDEGSASAAFVREPQEEQEPVPDFIKYPDQVEGKPAKARELIGSERGTAYHRVFELIDYDKDLSYSGIKQQIEEFVAGGFLEEEAAHQIRIKDITAFAESPVGKRMGEAARAGKLHREQPFTILVPADTVRAEYPADEEMLIQGIIDAYFETDDGIVIVDYKTDRVNNIEELDRLYRTQLEYYGKALWQLTGKKVRELIIYSVKFGKELKL